MLDRNLIEILAADLRTNPGLIEKDWHVVRAIGVLATVDHGDVTPVFSGGTSLSKGWGLLKRFSEDIDFKVAMPASGSRSKDRKRRKIYRDKIVTTLAKSEFELVGDVFKGNEDAFFRADFAFKSLFNTGPGLRPHLRIEMSFTDFELPPLGRPIRSLLADASKDVPEIPSFLCVDPVETAADKLSALAWRVCIREYGAVDDDPTIVRHLHDLAALYSHIQTSEIFLDLVHKAVAADVWRGGSKAPAAMIERFAMMLERLRREKFWADDYEQYVRQVSFAKPAETIDFEAAMASLTLLTDRFQGTSLGDV